MSSRKRYFQYFCILNISQIQSINNATSIEIVEVCSQPYLFEPNVHKTQYRASMRRRQWWHTAAVCTLVEQ